MTGCICAAIIVHFFWAFPAEGADCKTFSQISSEEKLLAFDNEYYFGNYRKVIEMYEEEASGGGLLPTGNTSPRGESERAEPHTDEMTFFYCLSLAQLDQLPDKLMSIDAPVLGTFFSARARFRMLTVIGIFGVTFSASLTISSHFCKRSK